MAEVMRSVLRSRVSLGTLCLVTVGLTDLIFTILLMGRGFGEGNPLFRHLLDNYGPGAFIAGKAFLLGGPVLLLEFVRTKNPQSAERGTWIAFNLYFALLAGQFVRLGR
jgi:hypothetical protein